MLSFNASCVNETVIIKSREIRKLWSKCKLHFFRQNNVLRTPLVSPKKIYLQLLHIKLVVMKFVKTKDVNSTTISNSPNLKREFL